MRPNSQPEYRSVPGALFAPLRTSRVALVARDYGAMKGFFEDVAGLRRCASDDDVTLYCGTESGQGWDLALLAPRESLRPGLHHVVMELDGGVSVGDSSRAAQVVGAALGLTFDQPDKQSVFVRDPDGLPIEFRRSRARSPEGVSRVPEAIRAFAL